MSKFLTHALLALSLYAVAVAPCRAQDASDFKFNASYTEQSDSNLFRLPESANTTAVLGRSSGAEQTSIATVGMGVHLLQGLQAFDVDIGVVDYRHRNFQYLSFTATNYDASWRWALTPSLSGSLTTERKETLNSFADYQGYNVRNVHLDTSTHLDGVYEVDGLWRILAGVAQSRQTNQQAVTSGDDTSSDSANAGLRYAFASGSTVTYKLIASDGAYNNRALTQSLLLDDRFNQIDHDFRVHLLLGEGTVADANITHIHRSHPTFSQRDYSGFNVAAALNWALSGKSALVLGYAHELGSYATANSNYTQTDRITLGPVWQISSKAQLALRTVWSQVEFLGTPGAIALGQRRDTNRDTTLSFNWQPRQKWMITTALQALSRGSNAPGLDYDSNVVSLSASYTY
jgi:exopolysaccharide biosynthesis operon protein EpsL